MLKAAEMRQKTVAELQSEEKRLSELLFKSRMEHAVGQLNNPKLLTITRRELAMVKTMIREKQGQ